jgi:NDP-sugar pyrophosphorylase family protein
MGELTSATPKPMLKIKGRPIIEWILKRYHSAGFKIVHVAVRYLAAKIIDRYGKDYEGMALNYLVERDALGTAGALSLLPSPAPLVVSNGDLSCNLDWLDLIQYHEHANGIIPDATICSAPWQIPFGCVDMGEDLITERPCIRLNAGMYLLESHVVKAAMMASAHKQNMPDLINRIKLFGGHVGVYELPPGSWNDVGTPADLERANA